MIYFMTAVLIFVGCTGLARQDSRRDTHICTSACLYHFLETKIDTCLFYHHFWFVGFLGFRMDLRLSLGWDERITLPHTMKCPPRSRLVIHEIHIRVLFSCQKYTCETSEPTLPYIMKVIICPFLSPHFSQQELPFNFPFNHSFQARFFRCPEVKSTRIRVLTPVCVILPL